MEKNSNDNQGNNKTYCDAECRNERGRPRALWLLRLGGGIWRGGSFHGGEDTDPRTERAIQMSHSKNKRDIAPALIHFAFLYQE